jgi:hypothetical protein
MEECNRSNARDKKRRHWEGQLHKWQQSGLSQASFCRRHSLKISNFAYWKKKLPQSSSTVTFMPLPLSSSWKKKNIPLRLVLNGGLQIEVSADFDPAALKQLIHTVRHL